MTKITRTRLIVLAIFLVVACVVAWFWRSHKRTSDSGPTAAGINRTQATSNPAAPIASAPSNMAQNLDHALANLQNTTDAAIARQHLAGLRQSFSTTPTNESVAAIRKFLDSKKDASLSQGFHVDGGGFLTEAPTLRTFLLDQLERLDPAAAAEYAKTILASKDSPDEWAVALRSLAHGDSSAEGRSLLVDKV